MLEELAQKEDRLNGIKKELIANVSLLKDLGK